MKELVAALLAWIAAEAGLVMPPPPAVVLAPAEEIRARVGTGSAGIALYDRDTAVVYLRDDWDLTAVAGRAALLHELVHHAQAFNELPAPCPAARERQAYELTLKWLAEQGVRDPYAVLDLDEFTVVLISLCLLDP